MQIEEEERVIFEQKDLAKSSGNTAERVLVWSKEAKTKEEEEMMFLKQRSCEKNDNN